MLIVQQQSALVLLAYPEEGIVKGVVIMLKEGVLLPCTVTLTVLTSFIC